MKKIKHILVFLLLVGITLGIYAGTKTKPVIRKSAQREQTERKATEGFPDLINFTNYINQ